MRNAWLNDKLLTLFGIKDQVVQPNLEKVASSHINVLNALYRLYPWPIHIGQQAYEISAEWSPEHSEILDAWTIIMQSQDSWIELVVEHSILQHCASRIDPSLVLSELSNDVQALVLEYVFDQTLAQLEATFQTSLTIHAVITEAGPSTLDAPVNIALRLRNEAKLSSPCLLRLASSDLIRLGTYMDRFPEQTHRFANIYFPVHVRWGMVELSVTELQSLSPGDVILPDNSCVDPDTAMLVFADQFIAKGQREGEGYRLIDDLKRMETNNIWAQYQNPLADHAVSDISVRKTNIRVVFDLCWSEISRNELENLGVYDILHGCSTPNIDINIIVDGTRIGLGTMTAIGEAVGIQVTRL